MADAGTGTADSAADRIDGPGGSADATDPGFDGGSRSDSGATSTCPADPPENSAACAPAQLCLYQRCPTGTTTQARCQGTTWLVDDLGCQTHSCGQGVECAATEVCLEVRGGPLSVECAANPCGDSPIEAACACGLCSAGDVCTVSGDTVICNACPEGGCR